MVSATSTAARAAAYVPATSGAAESRPQNPARPPAWTGSRARAATASSDIPSNMARFGYVSADRNGRSIDCARSSDQATSRNRTSPGSWTAVIGPSPWAVGACIGKPPSAASADRILSARSATSLAGTGMPMNVSIVMSCARWAGE